MTRTEIAARKWQAKMGRTRFNRVVTPDKPTRPHDRIREKARRVRQSLSRGPQP